MNFNSYIFILCFLPLTLAGYFILGHFKKYRAADVFLAVCSLLFYGWFRWTALAILLASVLVNFGISRLVNKRKLLLAAGIILNVVFLCAFKYGIGTLNIAMTLGISFYTFQQIAYLTDSYRGETSDVSFIEYLVFITFFPQLVQGPILLHDDFIPAFRDTSRKHIDPEHMLQGIYAFSLGLGKKVLIADSLSAMVAAGYADIGSLSGFGAVFTMLAYTLQLYFDFSGYCDMALGIGRMFNLDIPVNFNSPYKAVSIADFWDRWHITLTRFFTKYIYIPLGGSRRGTVRTYLNILIIFFVSGLWHGATMNFVLWGMMNGLAMVLYRIFRKQWDALAAHVKALAVGITFIFDIFAWGMFRAGSIAEGLAMYRHVFTGGAGGIAVSVSDAFYDIFEAGLLQHMGLAGITTACPGLFPCIFIIILMVTVFAMRNTQEKMEAYRPTARKMLVSIVLIVWCVLSFGGVTTFLYNNF